MSGSGNSMPAVIDLTNANNEHFNLRIANVASLAQEYNAFSHNSNSNNYQISFETPANNMINHNTNFFARNQYGQVQNRRLSGYLESASSLQNTTVNPSPQYYFYKQNYSNLPIPQIPKHHLYCCAGAQCKYFNAQTNNIIRYNNEPISAMNNSIVHAAPQAPVVEEKRQHVIASKPEQPVVAAAPAIENKNEVEVINCESDEEAVEEKTKSLDNSRDLLVESHSTIFKKEDAPNAKKRRRTKKKTQRFSRPKQSKAKLAKSVKVEVNTEQPIIDVEEIKKPVTNKKPAIKKPNKKVPNKSTLHIEDAGNGQKFIYINNNKFLIQQIVDTASGKTFAADKFAEKLENARVQHISVNDNLLLATKNDIVRMLPTVRAAFQPKLEITRMLMKDTDVTRLITKKADLLRNMPNEPTSEIQKFAPANNVQVTLFSCGECGKSFSNSKYLNRHIATHKTQCGMCMEMLPSFELLQKHIQYHNSARLFCTFCNRDFSRQTVLDAHIKTCAGNASVAYKCDRCQLTFGSEQELADHMNLTIHIKEDPC